MTSTNSISFITRPEAFPFDGVTYLKDYISETLDGSATIIRAGDTYNLYRFMPHDAFDALVEAIVAEACKHSELLISCPYEKPVRVHTPHGGTPIIRNAATSIARRGADSPWKMRCANNAP